MLNDMDTVWVSIPYARAAFTVIVTMMLSILALKSVANAYNIIMLDETGGDSSMRGQLFMHAIATALCVFGIFIF